MAPRYAILRSRRLAPFQAFKRCSSCQRGGSLVLSCLTLRCSYVLRCSHVLRRHAPQQVQLLVARANVALERLGGQGRGGAGRGQGAVAGEPCADLLVVERTLGPRGAALAASERGVRGRGPPARAVASPG